jgi:hypothetical protein
VILKALSKIHEHYSRSGVVGLAELFSKIYLRKIVSDTGQSVFERADEWDILVVLDGCRVDALQELADEYEFVSPVGSHQSPGSTSNEWMSKTFTDEYNDQVAKTAYITANPFSESELDHHQFGLVDEVWKYGWDNKIGTVRAEIVTDRGIATWRDRNEKNINRMIIHYMQPHFPCVPNPYGHSGLRPDDDDFDWVKESVWAKLRTGNIDKMEAWDRYLENLAYVLEEVESLTQNVDGSVVITADHGNAFGEWFQWGHPGKVTLDCLRAVPWSQIDANDRNQREPNVEPTEKKEETALTEKLSALGYIE